MVHHLSPTHLQQQREGVQRVQGSLKHTFLPVIVPTSDFQSWGTQLAVSISW